MENSINQNIEMIVEEEERVVLEDRRTVAGLPVDNQNSRNTTHKRNNGKIQWNEEMKKVLIECYNEVRTGEVGYRERLKSKWDRKMPNLKHNKVNFGK